MRVVSIRNTQPVITPAASGTWVGGGGGGGGDAGGGGGWWWVFVFVVVVSGGGDCGGGWCWWCLRHLRSRTLVEVHPEQAGLGGMDG